MVKSYHNKKGLRNLRNPLKFGGAKRDRTADLLNAIQALSQLSYSPEQVQIYSREVSGCQQIFTQIPSFVLMRNRSVAFEFAVAARGAAEEGRQHFETFNGLEFMGDAAWRMLK